METDLLRKILWELRPTEAAMRKKNTEETLIAFGYVNCINDIVDILNKLENPITKIMYEKMLKDSNCKTEEFIAKFKERFPEAPDFNIKTTYK